MRILVLGSGAREHAIVKALLAEEAGHEITAVPGNAGIAAEVETVRFDASNPVLVADYAKEYGAELVVIGPEAPLIAGVADRVRMLGIPVFGPSKDAAQLEGSKAFAKRVMAEAQVPTGQATRAASLDELETALDVFGAPYVVKADGLAAGKGVIVTSDRDAAVDHARFYLQQGQVLVEEHLRGREVSLFLLSDGHDVLPLSPAQDYKRAFDGDEGPNTGGMGAYSPLPWLQPQWETEADFVDEVIDTVARPVIRLLEAEGTPFVGLLYCGLMITDAGIRVIEFNARFGDPETQVVLARLETPLSELMLAAATGGLARLPYPRFRPDAAVSTVLASAGYPENPVAGRQLIGLDRVRDVIVDHAATALVEDRWIVSGGRVLSVVGVAPTFTAAREKVYAALGELELEGSFYRRDIAAAVAASERAASEDAGSESAGSESVESESAESESADQGGGGPA
ncbi:MAG: phosphoribosylamine--glycine ligase [Micrococcales bacterium]|nr:phosphoribosylamine--glycine ligase [Micrococcales bacterium]